MERRAYLAALSVLIAGCNGSDSPTATRTTTSQTATTTPESTRTATRNTTQTATRTSTQTTTEEATTTEPTTEEPTTESTPTPEELARDDLRDAERHFGAAVETYESWGTGSYVRLHNVTMADSGINPLDLVRIVRKAGKALDRAAGHGVGALEDEIGDRRRLNRWILGTVRAQHALAQQFDQFEELVEDVYWVNKRDADEVAETLEAAATAAEEHYESIDDHNPADAHATDHLAGSVHMRKTDQIAREIASTREFVQAAEHAESSFDTFADGVDAFVDYEGAGGTNAFANAADSFDETVDQLDAIEADALREVADGFTAVLEAVGRASEKLEASTVHYLDDEYEQGFERYESALETLETDASVVLTSNREIEELQYVTPPKEQE